jgi:hydrogenase expression/formation protein HypC
MCLGVPAEVVELLDDDWTTVNVGGVRKPVSIALLDDVAVGDYVIVHVGFALQKIDPEKARETLKEMAETLNEGLPSIQPQVQYKVPGENALVH